jgi:hypothetical protein
MTTTAIRGQPFWATVQGLVLLPCIVTTLPHTLLSQEEELLQTFPIPNPNMPTPKYAARSLLKRAIESKQAHW